VKRDGKSYRQVVGYDPSVTLDDAVFHVDNYNLRKFQERPPRRTVHALVVGIFASFDAITANGKTVLCQPDRFYDGTFRRASDDHIARRAIRVILHPDKRIEAVSATNETRTMDCNKSLINAYVFAFRKTIDA
jgi:hypothetical protein